MGRYSLKNLSSGLAAKIPDKRQLKEMGMITVGGALGGVAYSLVLDKVGWFQSASTETGATLKKAGLAVGLALVAGAALWNVQRDIASGLIGAMGAELGRTAMRKVGVLKGLGTSVYSYDNVIGGEAGMPLGQLGTDLYENEYVFGGSPLAATLASI